MIISLLRLLPLALVLGCGDKSDADPSVDGGDSGAPGDEGTGGGTGDGGTGGGTGDDGGTGGGSGDDGGDDDGIVLDGGVRTWADGSLAGSCAGYRTPGDGHRYVGDVGDGVYRIDAGDAGALDVLCDMQTDGGGWTLVSQARPSLSPGHDLCTAAAVDALTHDPTTVDAPAKLSDAAINAVWADGTGDRGLRILHDQDSTAADRSAWDRDCTLDFADDFDFSAGTTGMSLDDLDDPTMRCSDGDVTFDAAVGSGSYWCGFGFTTPGSSFVVTWSATPGYTFDDCGLGSDDVVGRGWAGVPNYGCSVQKVYVR